MIEFEYGENYRELVEFKKNGQEVTEFNIPANYTYNGKNYKITKIGDGIFYNCLSLKSVTIPNSVKKIDKWAFGYCRALTMVNMPNSIIQIGDYTFTGCSSLTSVIIPNSVTEIGNYAFAECSSLKNVTIPDSVTQIGSSAFYGVQHIEYYGTATGAPWGAKSMN